jgi:dolichyl-phosphate beta-glucosyltransferase
LPLVRGDSRLQRSSSGSAAADDRFAALRTDGYYGFDVELLLLARHRSYRTIETPVNWAESPGSKVSVLRHGPDMLAEILLVRWRLGRGSRDGVRA